MRWRRGLCAATMAVTTGVVGLVRPAQAAHQARTAAVFDWAGLVLNVAGLLFGGGSSDSAIAAAVAEIKAASSSRRTRRC